MYPNFTKHPKFLLFKKALGCADAAEYLLRIWGHCQERKLGESWGKKNADYVEAIGGWLGEPGKLFQALTADFCGKPGWITVGRHKELTVTAWGEHNHNLVTSWQNGSKGGRPARTSNKPARNPRVNRNETGDKPPANPSRVTGLDLTGSDLTNSGGGNFVADSEVNCPPSMPEVVAYGLKKSPAIPQAVSEEFWRYWQGRGWYVTPTVHMTDYRPKLDSWFIKVSDQKTAAPGKPPPDLAQLEAEYDAERDQEKRRVLRDKIKKARGES